MQELPSFDDPNLLVGAEHFSDAGVYRINEHTAIVQTVDFFSPLVDDPFVFGQIAATNSLSDVFAMGGQPKTALNIVAFPDDKLDFSVLQEILQGGAERTREAGAVLLGGHSVRDAEIKYGLSVTGVVDPDRMMTNRAAKPGDVLVLTKALGTGFITTADRANKCGKDVLKAASDSMVMLNSASSRAAVDLGAKAATDITGFGLAGHAFEMASASEVAVHIEVDKLPLLPGAEKLARDGFLTRANPTNREFAETSMRIEGSDGGKVDFIFDPQTSGGLLIAIDESKSGELIRCCHDGGMSATCVVGHVREKEEFNLVVHA